MLIVAASAAQALVAQFQVNHTKQRTQYSTVRTRGNPCARTRIPGLNENFSAR